MSKRTKKGTASSWYSTIKVSS